MVLGIVYWVNCEWIKVHVMVPSISSHADGKIPILPPAQTCTTNPIHVCLISG